MWASQFYRFIKPRQFITSGGLGTMGFGVPASIGAQIDMPNDTVIDFVGEHSFIIEQAAGNKIRFIDREIFNGLLVSSQAKDIDTNSKQGFQAMDKALKARAERK